MIEVRSRTRTREAAIDFYLLAKSIVLGEGFGHEITWQDEIRFTEVTETIFLREAAWVVLSSGMRETVVRNKFRSFSSAFYDWVSAQQIRFGATHCKTNAFRVFGHSRKIDSIIRVACEVDLVGFECFKTKISEQGISFLRSNYPTLAQRPVII